MSLGLLNLNLRIFVTDYTENMFVVRIHIFLVLFTVILLGCDDDSPQQQPGKTIRDFIIPVDGKLKEDQVLDYIAIRKKIIREANARHYARQNSLSENDGGVENKNRPRYFDEIEQVVAEMHGMSYAEYLWIKDAVITTQTQLWLRQYYEANSRIVNLLDRTLSRYREIANGNDKQEQNNMKAYVVEMKQELKNLKEKIPQLDNESEAFIYNSALVFKYKVELESLK